MIKFLANLLQPELNIVVLENNHVVKDEYIATLNYAITRINEMLDGTSHEKRRKGD